MRPRPGFLQKKGYRLPTEVEWEYACRAGAVTSRFFGQSEEPAVLGHYACCERSPWDGTLLPVGSLKPNDFGLFDMLGNCVEWVQNPFYLYQNLKPPQRAQDFDDLPELPARPIMLLRGGGYRNHSMFIRCAFRLRYEAADRNVASGFRIARTVR
jgi:formylglycine-generating enzyme required for sulfatase activity